MLMDHWAAGLAATEENAPMRMVHEGRGNGVGPLALLDGRCDLAPMSRKMTDAEVHAFVERHGGEPLAVPVAVDALAVVVADSSKIDAVTPDDVFRIFHLGPEQVKATGVDRTEDGTHPRVYGVNSASERYRWFKEAALHGKKFSDLVLELPDPLRLVSTVKTEGGIGYARLAEMTDGVRALPIDMGFGKIVTISPQSARSGLYPFTRFLYLYLPPPGSPVHPKTHAFIDYVLSDAGQDILESQGLYPLARKEQIYNANRLAKYRGQQ